MPVPPAKKRRLAKNTSIGDSIVKTEKNIYDAVIANTSLNLLADLVSLACTIESAGDTSKAIYALYRSFVVIFTRSKIFNTEGDKSKIVRTWIFDQLNNFVDFLTGLLKDEEKALRMSSLQILMSLQKHLSTLATKLTPTGPQFHISHFRKIISGLLLCPQSSRPSQETNVDRLISPDILEMFHDKWFSVYDDIRWFFLRESGTMVSSPTYKSQKRLPENLLAILERLNTFPTEQKELNAWWVEELGKKPKFAKGTLGEGADAPHASAGNDDEEDDWRKFFDDDTSKSQDTPKLKENRIHTMNMHQSLHSLASHRAVFTRAWLSLLPKLSTQTLDGDRRLVVRALNSMHQAIIPHLTRPILVMDWIGECIDLGGTPGLLALNALFFLMSEYNLDYPAFYTRLYSFLDREILHLKHRARFFRMTELFLSSTHLPATLLASFIKRLARLSISAPPAAIVMIIPFTYNIIKTHPALMVMLHHTDDGIKDTFDNTEKNPILARALTSSLWELHSHRNHYHSAVSTLAKIFEEAFTKQSYAMEDFLDSTYGTLFETEARRKIRKTPALGLDLRGPNKNQYDIFGANEGDAINELWSFT